MVTQKKERTWGVQWQFGLYKAFVYIDSSRKFEIHTHFCQTCFLDTCATCSDLPSNISAMGEGVFSQVMWIQILKIIIRIRPLKSTNLDPGDPGPGLYGHKKVLFILNFGFT